MSGFSNFGSLVEHMLRTTISSVSTGVLKMSIRNGGIKGVLSDLRQYLAIETHLKMMKNVFYFT